MLLGLRLWVTVRFITTLGLGVAMAVACSSAGAQSSWVHVGRGGKLEYSLTPKGDRIPDFSSAGYEGGAWRCPRCRPSARLRRR